MAHKINDLIIEDDKIWHGLTEKRQACFQAIEDSIREMIEQSKNLFKVELLK